MQEKVPWIDESWTPEVAGISERIALDAANVQDFKRLQDAWARAGSAAGRFMKPLGDKYEVSSFSVFCILRAFIGSLYVLRAGSQNDVA